MYSPISLSSFRPRCLGPWQLVNIYILIGLPWWFSGKESTGSSGDTGSTPGLGRSSGEEMAIHFSILAGRIPRTEEPGGLQSMELQSQTRVSMRIHMF